jgi:hypothetical protein
MSDSSPVIRRLTCTTLDGKPYERPEATEAEIVRMLPLPHSDWVAEAPKLPSEALLYLIREVDGKHPDVFTPLLHELMKRVAGIAIASALGFNEPTTEHILFAVERQIYELVVARKPTRQSEFLEVAFGQAVERRTINEVQKYQASGFGNRRVPIGDAGGDDDDEEGLDSGFKDPVDPGFGPEASLLKKENKELRHKWYRKARKAVKDPRDLEAVALRVCDGWPVTSGDPEEPTLVTYFGEPEGKVRYRIERAMEQMRKALGVSI